MTAIAILPADTSELVATIERARLAFDAGDVQAAFLLSSGAYEQAKAAGRYAEKVKASREMIDKARRMQADALKIESLCTVAMADAVDEAQTQGKLSRGGRPETVQSEDRFSLEDVGIDKRRLHEARHLRNAERAQPGFIDRVVEARVNEGLEPSRASIKTAAGHAIGTKSATDAEKGDQLYETPIEATRTLLALESFSGTVKEPFVGRGAILRPLEDAGYDVLIADLVDRGISTRHGELQQVGDFRLSEPGESVGFDIVTNPPYDDLANECLTHALRVHKPRKMAALLNLNFQCGFDDPNRRYVMDENPPSRIYIFTKRLPMMHRDGWDGPKASSQMNTGWYVWERNDDGSYGSPDGWRGIRVFWPDYEHAAALPPGAGGHVGPMAFRGAGEVDEFARETPRKSVEERVDEDLQKAIDFATGMDLLSAAELRRGIGVRPLVGEALMAALVDRGMFLSPPDGDGRYLAASHPPTPVTPEPEADPLYASALALTAETGRASVDYFKRELKLGQAKAAGLMARLIADGLVSEPDAAGRRTVFIEKIKGADRG
ncbi:DNA translocase FtsK [Agrobacterium vitis]